MFRLSTVWNLPQQKEGSYGPLEQHMQELPHPSRNLTVSRVVIMVSILLWMSTPLKECLEFGFAEDILELFLNSNGTSCWELVPMIFH